MSLMRSEIDEQPDVVARLAADLRPYRDACAQARGAGVRFVLYAARGTSDNAAVYGKYLATILAGMPAALAVPSAVTLYRAPVQLRDCLVVGISQSGHTPDVAEYLGAARRGGAFTIAVTNDDDSPLAAAAQVVLRTSAGAEQAVPATKTYTSQLAVLALLWATWTEDRDMIRAITERVPEVMGVAIAGDDAAVTAARRLRWADRLLVAARGFNFATALETALKLEETCYLPALPYSAADLMHGPIALVDLRWPALLFGYPGPAEGAMADLAAELSRRGADVTMVAPPGPLLEAAGSTLPFPAGLPEALSPLAAIVPAQLLAFHLAVERGIDPDRPRGLSKVTRTT